jgi:pimeloyl-ACP methyl ester carboxylesterase
MRKRPSPLTTLFQGAAATALGLAGTWILYSRVSIDHHAPLAPALDAERETFAGKTTGVLSYYVDRSTARNGARVQPPLMLVHSINAAGNAYEMRPIFETYRGHRPVYALDLPGFGFSERSDRVYSPALYKQAIIDLLEHIGGTADVVALSLGGEFAALAALERPELFRSLTLISPSGFTARENKNASQQASQSGTSDSLYRTFSYPLWGRPFYDLIATRASIHFFLQMSFEGQVDPSLEAYAYATSHQPGAHFAPLYFVSGKLFSPDIRQQVYEKLTLPALVLFDRDPFVRFDTLPDFVDSHDNWQSARIAPTKGLPQFEKMPDVARELDRFWEQLTVEKPQ